MSPRERDEDTQYEMAPTGAKETGTSARRDQSNGSDVRLGLFVRAFTRSDRFTEAFRRELAAASRIQHNWKDYRLLLRPGLRRCHPYYRPSSIPRSLSSGCIRESPTRTRPPRKTRTSATTPLYVFVRRGQESTLAWYKMNLPALRSGIRSCK